MASNRISLNPSSFIRILGAIAFLLVLASIGGQLIAYITGHDYVFRIAKIFYVTSEQNIPTFFSTFLLLFAAILLAVITVLEKNRMTPVVRYWMVLSLGFLLMAIDESVSIHERLIFPVRNLLGGGDLGIFYYAWVIPGIALILVLAPFFLRFLFHLPAKIRFTFLIAGIIYIVGCIGFELIGGRHAELHGLINLTYVMLVTVEESLEMAGVIIFIWGLLVYIADNYQEVRFRFDKGSEKNEPDNS